MVRISRAIPYLCGLPYARRMARRVVTLSYTCFVDDSGGDGRSPVFVLGAWIACCEAWERFSDAWEISLQGPPKALGFHKGKRYFRHTDAVNQKACFAGFTSEMATRKAINLAWLVRPFQDHMLGYAVTVPMDQHKAVVQDQAIVRRGNIHHMLKSPFYPAFKQLVPDVYESYWNQGHRDPIDIIVDGDGKTDKAFNDMKAIFDDVKKQTKGEPQYAVIGDIFQRSAKDLAPLQLADMLAGQTRMNHVDLRRAEVLRLWEKHKIQIHNHVVSQAEMEAWSQPLNVALATKVLMKIKIERDNPPVMSKRRVKKKKP